MSTLTEDPPVQVEIAAEDWRRDRARREWMLIGLALSCLVTLMAIVFAVFAFADGGDRPVARPAAAPAKVAAPARASGAPSTSSARCSTARSSRAARAPTARP